MRSLQTLLLLLLLLLLLSLLLLPALVAVLLVLPQVLQKTVWSSFGTLFSLKIYLASQDPDPTGVVVLREEWIVSSDEASSSVKLS